MNHETLKDIKYQYPKQLTWVFYTITVIAIVKLCYIELVVILGNYCDIW